MVLKRCEFNQEATQHLEGMPKVAMDKEQKQAVLK